RIEDWASEGSGRQVAVEAGRVAKAPEFGAKFAKNIRESGCRRTVGTLDFARFAGRLEDHVDRAILKMEPATIGKPANLRSRIHFLPRSGASGQGLSAWAEMRRLASSSCVME